MADKEKRLRKILDKKEMRGKLKLVATIEEACLILVDDRRYNGTIKLMPKESYLGMLEYGHKFLEENDSHQP